MPIKFLLLGGGSWFFGRGGGSADFIFMGVGIFPIIPWSKKGKTRELFDKFKAELRTEKDSKGKFQQKCGITFPESPNTFATQTAC